MGCSPTLANPCTGGSSRGSSSGIDTSGAAAQFGAGLVNMYKQAAADRAAAAQAAARAAAIQAAEAADRQRIEDEARKERLLNGMQGVGEGETLGLMLGDEPVADSISTVFARARARHDKEAALRREALERMEGKPGSDWCKLHLPQALVMPQRSFGDDRSYPSKIKKFAADRTEWDRRCGGPSGTEPTPLDADLALLQREPKAPPVAKAPVVEPKPAATGLQAGGLELMTDDAPPRASSKKEPAPVVAAETALTAANEPAKAPAPAAASLESGILALMMDEQQPKGWTASEAEPKMTHVVEGGAPQMPAPAPAPVFPAAPPVVRDPSAALSAAPASPGAYAFMRTASASAPREPPAKPRFVLPMLEKVLTVKEGAAFAAASVEVLYNLGAAPRETVETKTLLVYEKEEADKSAFEADGGVAVLPGGSVEWKDLTAGSTGPNRWLPAAGAKR